MLRNIEMCSDVAPICLVQQSPQDSIVLAQTHYSSFLSRDAENLGKYILRHSLSHALGADALYYSITQDR